MTQAPTLFIGASPTFEHRNGHILYAGASGTGKTQSLIALARLKLRNPLTGLIIADPEGEIAPAVAEFAANPINGLGRRCIHYLRPASPTSCFALPLLHVPDRNPLACHTKAVRTKEVFQQAINFGAPEYGPRLSKLFYLSCLALALNGRPLCSLPDLLTRGARELREALAAALPFPFLADEFGSLDLLNERTFLEYRDPLMSRLLMFGNAQLRRVFGPQPPLDIAHILRHREVVLLDLGGLEHADAVLVGKALYSVVHHEALQRTPNREPHTCIIVDEAFDYITADMARGFDRLRKRNVQLCVSLQRLAQLNRGEDDAVATMSAVISGTRTKVVFRMEDPNDADYMARVLFAGHVPLNEWKDGTERPVVVSHHKELVSNQSTAVHEASHEATGETHGVAHGRAATTMRSTTEADGESESEAVVDVDSLGSAITDATTTGAMRFDGTSTSRSMEPYTGGVVIPPLLTNLGEGASTGTGLSSSTSRASATSRNTAQGSSRATSRSHMTATSYGEAVSESEVRSRAVSQITGTSHGQSESTGQSETFVPTMEWLPSQLYSLPEQLHRLAGEIKTLPLRACFIKVDDAAPVRARTADLVPTFKSIALKRIMLRLAAKTQSPYLMPVAEADALLAAASISPVSSPRSEPDFGAAEPLPVIDDPDRFARDFHARNPGNSVAKPAKTRRPRGLSDKHAQFGVIDGDKADGDNDKQ